MAFCQCLNLRFFGLFRGLAEAHGLWGFGSFERWVGGLGFRGLGCMFALSRGGGVWSGACPSER